MAIKELMKRCEIADSPFRSLQEVGRYLDLVKSKIDDETNLLRQYQAQFARAERAAAQPETAAGGSGVFKINTDPGAGSSNRPVPLKRDNSPTINVTKIDKVVVPKMEALRKHFSIVDTLHEHIDSLDTMLGNLSVAFHGSRGLPEALNGIKLLKRNAQAELDKALKFLSDIGTKYAPEPFKELVALTSTEMIQKLQFEKAKTMLYCTEQSADKMYFTYYIQLTNLTDEDDGDTFPEFYVVFTAVLEASGREAADKKGLIKSLPSDQQNMSYYVTVMHHFETPGKFNPGRHVSDHNEATQALGVLMAGEGLNSAIGVLPHNLNPDDVTKDKFRVKNLISDINVEPDSLTFWFLTNVNKAAAVKATNSLLVDVRAMSRHMKKASFKVKSVSEGRRYGVRFSITNPAMHDNLDIDALDFLKTRFGVDDAKLRQIVKIFNS